MIRLIFLAVVVGLALVAGIALALQHFFGWKGLIAFPFILILLVWLGKKGIGYLFRRFALSLFSMKSRVLRGAALTVHSITPVPRPRLPEPESETLEDAEKTGGTNPLAAQEASGPAPQQSEEAEEPREYFEVDMTISPKNDNGQSVWEPAEFILTSEPISSLMQLEDGGKEVGNTELLEIWDGSAFVEDDPGK